MYITKALLYIVKMNILKNKDIREILLYKCVLVLCGDIKKREKYVFSSQNKIWKHQTENIDEDHLFRYQIRL